MLVNGPLASYTSEEHRRAVKRLLIRLDTTCHSKTRRLTTPPSEGPLLFGHAVPKPTVIAAAINSAAAPAEMLRGRSRMAHSSGSST